MKETTQYVITLSRLYLPAHLKVQKMIISVMTKEEECFIQNDKNVKNNKVNFYRENLFVSSISQGFVFKVYRYGGEKQREIMKVMEIGRDELRSVDRRSAMFTTKSQGFQLVWECGVFSDNDSQSYIETDREYSEFNGSIKFHSFQTQELTPTQVEPTQQQNCNMIQMGSTSTSSTSLNQINSSSPQKSQPRSQSPRPKQTLLNPLPSISSLSISSMCNSPRKNKKSQIYSNFMSNLTSMITSINHKKTS